MNGWLIAAIVLVGLVLVVVIAFFVGVQDEEEKRPGPIDLVGRKEKKR